MRSTRRLNFYIIQKIERNNNDFDTVVISAIAHSMMRYPNSGKKAEYEPSQSILNLEAQTPTRSMLCSVRVPVIR